MEGMIRCKATTLDKMEEQRKSQLKGFVFRLVVLDSNLKQADMWQLYLCPLVE